MVNNGVLKLIFSLSRLKERVHNIFRNFSHVCLTIFIDIYVVTAVLEGSEL